MRKPLPFGKYLLLDRIAVGGMAEVFAAKTFGVEGFERLVAIKRILPTMVEDDEFITMFIDEARIAAQLSHANLVQIYELGKHDDTYFISMEYVSGRDVRLLIDKFKKKGQTVPIPMAAFIMARMCEGLDFAHRKKDAQGRDLGIIHRDISPQNVLVSYEGDVKIIDFGIAKAAGRLQKTQAGILKGKFGYMSPEQVKGLTIDHRSDLYSCGVMLYEMLTGTKLFSGESDFSTLEKVRAGEVRAPSEINAEIPPALERIVLKALAKERDERYQWCSEFHDDLMRFLYSGNEVFSTKSLAAFMKEAFSTELVKEQDRQRRWHTTAPEETADFELATTSASHVQNQGTLPPTSVPPSARDAANAQAAQANGKVRIGPPSAFMTAELRLQDRTGLHEPFRGEVEKSPAVRSRPPPVATNGQDRSQLKTEAASLAELGLSYVAEEIDPDVEAPKQRGKPAVPFDVDSRRRPAAGARRPLSPEREPEPEPEQDEGEERHVDEQATRVKGVEPSNPSKPRAAPEPEQDSEAEPDLDLRPPRRGISKVAKAAIGALVLVIVVLAAVQVVRVFGVQKGSLALQVTPKNARILVDGQKQKNDALVIVRLPFGPHHLEVSADGFESYEDDFTIESKAPLQLEVKLDKSGAEEKEPAPAEADAEKPAADAEKSAEPVVAKEPKAREPAPKEATKEPAKEQPKEHFAKVAETPPTPKPVEKAPPPPVEKAPPPVNRAPVVAEGTPGGLNIFSSPPGAMLAVNGKMIGRTPQRLADLPGGKSVELKLVTAGYKPVTLTQEVPSGSVETLKITLEPVGGTNPVTGDVLQALGKPANPTPASAPGGTAKLTAMCLPTAQIVIDGKPSGRWTPISAANPLEVPAGHHSVLCEAANGSRSVAQEMQMEAGNTVQYKAKVQ